jgi:hypothetical protein
MDELYNRDPRSYALMLVQDGLVDAETMVLALVQAMAPDDVRYALDANEMSPRFDEEFDDSMDGDAESALASAGWGTDEDY